MDNELFELCKEVYERTGWKTDAMQFEYSETGEVDPDHRGEDDKTFAGYSYTSDYLLEKLPVKISKEVEYLLTVYGAYGNYWVANYTKKTSDEFIYAEVANTPLKALLKLTIALHDAGVKL